jgi:glutathione synthase/RimK-type ligase-like ATP-grasp enzyme
MIALVKDLNTNWWKKFSEILIERKIPYKIVEIEKDDWIEQISECKFVIWRPNLNEPFLDQAKEKIYIIEKVIRKKIYPNLDTFWHYDNKNSEYYLGKIEKIKMPEGFVSYSYEDTLQYLRKCKYPIVSKSKGGAKSKNVRLLKNYNVAKKELDKIFYRNFMGKISKKIFNKLNFISNRQRNYVNYQEFIPDNKKDLRIATIGGKYAYAFYRKNRKNDFRASGSGIIDFNIEKRDLNVIKYYIQLSYNLGFDSMGYDVIYKGNDFMTVEFSYTFPDKLRPQFYELMGDRLILHNKNTWPQELIIEYLHNKWQLQSLFTDNNNNG